MLTTPYTDETASSRGHGHRLALRVLTRTHQRSPLRPPALTMLAASLAVLGALVITQPTLISAEVGAEIGSPIPSLAGVSWATASDLQDRPWQLVVWWQPADDSDRGPAPALQRLAQHHGERVAIQVLHTGSANTIDADTKAPGYAAGVAGVATFKQWVSAESRLPLAVLVGPDRQVWWHGEYVDAARLIELVATENITADELKNLAALEQRLRLAVNRGDVGDVRLALTALTAFDPLHETALYVQLGLHRQRADRTASQQLLADLPAEEYPIRFLAELATDLLTDPEMAWRFPRQAARLLEQALSKDPNHVPSLLAYARLRLLTGDHQGAMAWLTTAQELSANELAGGSDAAMATFAEYLKRVSPLAQPSAPLLPDQVRADSADDE